MDRDTAITTMRMVMGFRTDLEATMIAALQLAQTQLQTKAPTPWFLISEIMSIDTEASEQRVVVPDGFLEEVDDAYLYYVDDEGTQQFITKDEFDTLSANYRTTAPGAPKAYALHDRYLRLFPTPDAVYTIYMMFMIEDEVLDTNIENLWLKYAPMYLIGEAGLMVAAGARDKDAMKEFTRFRDEGRAALIQRNESRRHANMVYQMGGPH